jgi:hypothetical protein
MLDAIDNEKNDSHSAAKSGTNGTDAAELLERVPQLRNAALRIGEQCSELLDALKIAIEKTEGCEQQPFKVALARISDDVAGAERFLANDLELIANALGLPSGFTKQSANAIEQLFAYVSAWKRSIESHGKRAVDRVNRDWQAWALALDGAERWHLFLNLPRKGLKEVGRWSHHPRWEIQIPAGAATRLAKEFIGNGDLFPIGDSEQAREEWVEENKYAVMSLRKTIVQAAHERGYDGMIGRPIDFDRTRYCYSSNVHFAWAYRPPRTRDAGRLQPWRIEFSPEAPTNRDSREFESSEERHVRLARSRWQTPRIAK